MTTGRSMNSLFQDALPQLQPIRSTRRSFDASAERDSLMSGLRANSNSLKAPICSQRRGSLLGSATGDLLETSSIRRASEPYARANQDFFLRANQLFATTAASEFGSFSIEELSDDLLALLECNTRLSPSMSLPDFNLVSQPVCPALNMPTPLEVRVLGMASSGGTSRVETQIKLCLQLIGNEDLVARYTNVVLPPSLLPPTVWANTATAMRHKTQVAQLGMQALHLQAAVVGAGSPNKPVFACKSCIMRERKRLQRLGKAKWGDNDDAGPQTQQERERIITFTTKPVLPLTSGNVILSLRLTCYSRHHNEPNGFRVYFKLVDSSGAAVAQVLTPAVLITDQASPVQRKPSSRRGSVDFSRPLPVSPPPCPVSLEPLSNHAEITVAQATPHIALVGQQCLLSGSGFQDGDQVCMAGLTVSTACLSNDLLAFVVPNMGPGPTLLTVLRPTNSSVASNSVLFAVAPAGPENDVSSPGHSVDMEGLSTALNSFLGTSPI